MRSTTRWKPGLQVTIAALAVCLFGAFGLATVALARDDGAPRTDPATATFTLSLVEGKGGQCAGKDGSYTEFRATFRGSIVSPDPRLTGDLKLRAHVLHNDTTEYGTVEGLFVVRDPGARKAKVVAKLHGVESPEVAGPHGFILGRVRRGEGGTRLFANFTATVEPGGGLTGQLGGTSDENATPAVIQSGHCAGPLVSFP